MREQPRITRKRDSKQDSQSEASVVAKLMEHLNIWFLAKILHNYEDLLIFCYS